MKIRIFAEDCNGNKISKDYVVNRSSSVLIKIITIWLQILYYGKGSAVYAENIKEGSGK